MSLGKDVIPWLSIIIQEVYDCLDSDMTSEQKLKSIRDLMDSWVRQNPEIRPENVQHEEGFVFYVQGEGESKCP